MALLSSLFSKKQNAPVHKSLSKVNALDDTRIVSDVETYSGNFTKYSTGSSTTTLKLYLSDNEADKNVTTPVSSLVVYDTGHDNAASNHEKKAAQEFLKNILTEANEHGLHAELQNDRANDGPQKLVFPSSEILSVRNIIDTHARTTLKNFKHSVKMVPQEPTKDELRAKKDIITFIGAEEALIELSKTHSEYNQNEIKKASKTISAFNKSNDSRISSIQKEEFFNESFEWAYNTSKKFDDALKKDGTVFSKEEILPYVKELFNLANKAKALVPSEHSSHVDHDASQVNVNIPPASYKTAPTLTHQFVQPNISSSKKSDGFSGANTNLGASYYPDVVKNYIDEALTLINLETSTGGMDIETAKKTLSDLEARNTNTYYDNLEKLTGTTDNITKEINKVRDQLNARTASRS